MGKPKQSIIELNGKRYDVRTGKQVTGDIAPAVKAVKPTVAKPVSKVVTDIKRTSSGASGIHRHTQRSQTLMRTGLKRPTARPKTTAVKARVVSDFSPATRPSAPIRLSNKSDEARQLRAQKIERSRLVQKFTEPSVKSQPVAAKLPVTLAPMPVQPAPAALLSAHKPNSIAANNLIERGLRNATGHTNTYKPAKKTKAKRKHGKLALYGASALAAVFLVGLVALENKAKIDVWYASSRSGVDAHVPGYLPAGFKMNQLTYGQNQIELNYQSNSDDRSFKITQTSSNLNSDSLRNVLGATDGDQPQTVENKGRTIYLYGDSNAAWVSNGIRYEIDGNSQLTTSQIIDIVSSL